MDSYWIYSITVHVKTNSLKTIIDMILLGAMIFRLNYDLKGFGYIWRI